MLLVVYISAGTVLSILRPVRRLMVASARIAKGDVEHGTTDFNSLFAVAGALFVMTLVMNVAARRVLRRYRQVYQ